MKLFVFIQFFFLISFLQAEDLCSLKIQVTGFKSNSGWALSNLFNNPDGYPSTTSKAYKSQKSPIEGNSAVFFYENIHCGEYALGVLHDENNNLKMDTNIVGIPKEGYGVSNNIKAVFGPPKYEDTKFLVSKPNTVISVLMRYF